MGLHTPYLAREAARVAKAAPRPQQPSVAQRNAVATWATTPLEAHTRAEVERGLAVLQQHPDAYASGFSPAKNARKRLESFLA